MKGEKRMHGFSKSWRPRRLNLQRRSEEQSERMGTSPDGSPILNRSPAGASYMITRGHARDIRPAVGPKSPEARVSPVRVPGYGYRS